MQSSHVRLNFLFKLDIEVKKMCSKILVFSRIFFFHPFEKISPLRENFADMDVPM